MRRFYSPLAKNSVDFFDLDLEQSKHLRNVLRLKLSDEIAVFDGSGNEFVCEVFDLGDGKKSAKLKVKAEIEPRFPESPLELNLAVALLKSDKFDLVVQKSVELGVSKLIPIVTKRCDIKPKSSVNKITRFERIIIEASKQCGRAKLMEITSPVDFKALLKIEKGEKVIFSETGGTKFTELKRSKKLTAFIGPEGGWDDSELKLASESDFQIITLGGRILRAETAAITMAGLLQHNFGDLN